MNNFKGLPCYSNIDNLKNAKNTTNEKTFGIKKKNRYKEEDYSLVEKKSELYLIVNFRLQYFNFFFLEFFSEF